MRQTIFATIFATILIGLAVTSRLLPHPANFTPLAAIALFGGVFLDRKYSMILPLVALFVSDYFIGFYSGMYWVYGAFLLVGLLGWWLKKHRGFGNTLLVTLLGSFGFFFITNFGVWLESGMYTHDLAGLAQCYGMAIPFLRGTIGGDLIYVALLFGVYAVAEYVFPAKYFIPTN